MQYNKSYLIVQSLKTQIKSQKRISEILGISQSAVSKILNNKQKTVRKKTELKINRQVKSYTKYNKNSKVKKHKYSDVVIMKTALYVSKYLEKSNNYRTLKARVKKLSKSKDLIEDVKKGYKKYIETIEDDKFYKDQLGYYDFIRDGYIEVI